MKDNGLESRYRNLLISLARDAEALQAKVTVLHDEVKAEPRISRRNAIRTIIAERNRQRSRLLFLLSRNAAASKYFFGTVNPQEISCEQILFAD